MTYSPASVRPALLVVVASVLSACGPAQPGPWVEGDGFRWRELPEPSGAKAGLAMVEPAHTGIDFQNRVSSAHRIQNQLLTHGSGVAIGDVDGDGLPDIALARVDGDNALYRNLGNWRFEDITASAGVARHDRNSTGLALADVDGDGDLDLFAAARGQPNALFLNDGAGRFTDVTAAAGLGDAGGTTTLTLADVEGDGDLDLYVTNYKARKAGDVFSPHELAFDQVVKRRGDRYVVDEPYRGYFRLKFTDEGMIRWAFGDPDVLYLNDGSGSFTRASWTDGRFLRSDGEPLDSVPDEWGLTARFHDVNGDRAPDLYVSNDFESPDQFWINRGDGTFAEVAPLAIRSTSASSMAVDFSDVDRDGLTDFFVVDMLAKDPARRRTQIPTIAPEVVAPGEIAPRLQRNRNTLFMARDDGTFLETARAAGVEASGWSWSTIFLDIDLDGYEDVLVTTGHVWDVLDADTQSRLLNTVVSEDWREVINEFPPLELPNTAFRNLTDGSFEDVSEAWGFDLGPDVSHAIATGDLDLDGDLDVVVNRLGFPVALLDNRTPAPRIAVSLSGRPPNTHGIGANVRLLGSEPEQQKEIAAGGAYLSSSEPLASFAVPGEGPHTLVVEWRSGANSVVENVMPGRLYEIAERGAADSGAAPRLSAGPAAPALASAPLFEDVSARLDHVHVETAFNDFARQPLLPYRLSQLGPGVTWTDLDEDGDPDLVVASGSGGRLGLLRNDGARFTALAGGPAATGFDQTMALPLPTAAGPGLLVGQSNYEAASPEEARTLPGGTLLRFVDGSPSAGVPAIPPWAATVGALAAADLDGDGNLEVLVGSRGFPAAYPEPPPSRLFRLRNGVLEVDSVASTTLATAGLVSGAVFTDLDDDGDPDLALATDWGPVRIFLNHLGRLTDVTGSWGLGALSGRWNGVTTGDFDGDGLMDLVVTSWGRNTNHRPTSERPLHLYWGDFDGRGALDLLEAMPSPEGGVDVPETDLARLSTAVPYVRVEQVRTFSEFARASVRDVLGEDAMRRARVEVAVTLDHLLLLNRGGSFEVVPLPLEAQLAPAFHAAVADFDGNGTEDLFLSQNFFPNEVNLQRYEGGRGLLLLGDGIGGLTPVSGSLSGIRVYGDQRGAAVADFDGDARPDLAISQNGSATVLLRNVGAAQGLRVRLVGPPGNPRAVGARVRVRYADGSMGPVRELHLGEGYWSVNGAVPVLGLSGDPAGVEVRWPGGRHTEVPVVTGAREVVARWEVGG